ncbi:hypothetical protein B0H13DRAFT_466853 [Mycena leptocephala]|nr:hypothetical protein B0H13DRAFT_466853 [Mycena leptocephala]
MVTGTNTPDQRGGGLASIQNSSGSSHSNSNGAGGGLPRVHPASRVAHQTEMTQASTPEYRADPTHSVPIALGGHLLRLGAVPAPRTKGAGTTFCGAAASICRPSSQPPSIRRHRHYRSASSGGSVRSDAGGWAGLAMKHGARSGPPVPIPNVSPRRLLRPPDVSGPVCGPDHCVEAERHDRAHHQSVAQPAQARSHLHLPCVGAGLRSHVTST